MERTGLTDLDERVFEVRDKASRDLIREAIQAYRGGAYRSAIISTWIAISFDIISKVRELAAYGEANAAKFTKDLDKAIQNNDRPKLQTFERDLLTKAKEEFQIITEREFHDLERIMQDRHQCAHPAFVGEGVLFQPLPELVRNHIVQAIDILLSHAPMQGKSALEQLERDLFSPSFPNTAADIKTFMNTRYVERVNDSGLVKVMQSIISRLLGTDQEKYHGKEAQFATVLHALRSAKPALFSKELEPWIKSKTSSVHDERLLSLIPFTVHDPSVWSAMDAATQAEIKALIGSASEAVIKKVDIYSGLSMSDLKPALMERFISLPEQLRTEIISSHPMAEFAPHAIEFYRASKGFRSAEWNGKNLILPLAKHLDADQIKQVLDVVLTNRQVREAGENPEIIAELFDLTKDVLPKTNDIWRNFITAIGKGKKRKDYYAYPEVRERLKQHGIMKK